MIFHGASGTRYLTGAEIGRGGEGTVYSVQGNNDIVIKRYNEAIGVLHVQKLERMVAMGNVGIDAYAAWPKDLVRDEQGQACGFVMRKLTGYVPLHMIFSPMDRKKLFPDKGYNFLVHVARNLCTAFYQLHQCGLVVGDVNEGNILISSTGMVSFIDCDSFQVQDGDQYFYCEVGVPRYTPPELLARQTFDQVVRTVNTDSFSMAVLVFQLLFLGRHPFAGKNKTAVDIDEETAIKMHEFAYSLEHKRKKLAPPKDSFDINNLTDELIALFHQAFERPIRPTPAEWVAALDAFLAGMVTCGVTKLHTYPGKMAACPWCYFRQTRGILYFLDDTYLKANSIAGDIDSFVQGFRLEQLALPKWDSIPAFPDLKPAPIGQYFKRRVQRSNLVRALSIVIYCGIVVYLSFYLLVFIAFVLIFLACSYDPQMKVEENRLLTEVDILKADLDRVTHELTKSREIQNYSAGLAELEALIADFKALPAEMDRLKKELEERLYNEQVQFFLSIFNIADFTIPLIGSAKKTALLDAGIRTAADISLLQTMKVPGIGAKLRAVLLDWQRQMQADFVYIPDANKLNEGMAQVSNQLAAIRLQRETVIRKSYQSITYLKLNITNRNQVLARQVLDISRQLAQAELDYQAFKQFSKFYF